MGVYRLVLGGVVAGALLLAAFTAGAPGHAQSDAQLKALKQRVLELVTAGKYGEAVPLAERYVEAIKVDPGPDDPEYAIAVNNLAVVLRGTNRLTEAEQLMRRALAIDEKSYGPEHPNVARDLGNLAALLQDTNRLEEAELLKRRALTVAEKSFGSEHPNVAIALNNLALLLKNTDHLSEAEFLYRRALQIWQKNLGTNHPQVATGFNNLAGLLSDTNRLVEAERLYRRALAIDEESYGPEHPDVARDIHNLAALLQDSNRLAEAEPLYRRALAVAEKRFGSEHPNVATALNSLGHLLQATNRTAEAEALYRRALAIGEKTLGAEHPSVARDLNDLGVLRAEIGEWTEAVHLHKRAKPIMIAAGTREDRAGIAKAVLAMNTLAFRGHARAIYRANGASSDAREEGLELAQLALQTGAADALSQMSVRFAKGTGPLAMRIREQQDLLSRRHMEMRGLDAAVGRADADGAREARDTVAALDKKLDAIDAQLAAEKEYAELANPKPLTIAAAQALLTPDEALIVFLDVPQFGNLPEETLAWIVTKDNAAWRSIPSGTRALDELVTALRCGVDESLWAGIEEGRDCRRLLALPADFKFKRTGELPFSLSVAHDLYQQLLGPFEDLIQGKHLIIVPSGPLSRLPFAALVTKGSEQPIAVDNEAYRRTAWLGSRQPISVLPAVSSLRALRDPEWGLLHKRQRAAEPFIGFGDPDVRGRPGKRCKPTSKIAIPKECPTSVAVSAQAALAEQRSSEPLPPAEQLFRSGLANPVALRAQCPLPESAFELSCVGKSLQAPESLVYTRRRATETVLKKLSQDRELERYQVVHFATHGLLGGDTQKMARSLAEPALLLTPPEGAATEEDDGLLTASEIAQLKLNADWVVMSACNTAGTAGDPGPEPLSGLARAFFYAGARALLVSHWRVDSWAAVWLLTDVFRQMQAVHPPGRAEALRSSMSSLIREGHLSYAHPSYWAPFVVVGEGAK